MFPPGVPNPIQSVRHFNRFYTNQLGILADAVYNSSFSVAETRILYELAHRDNLTASQLVQELHLDPGYLSRILRSFEKNKLLRRTPSPSDARRHILTLTPKGRQTFAPLEKRSAADVRDMLAALSPLDQSRLLRAMQTIEDMLTPQSRLPAESFLIRDHQPGDMGWVVQQHGELYAREYGLNHEFEAFVATLVSRFLTNFNPAREHCWIAERYGEIADFRGEIAGAVFLVSKSPKVAQLRMLIVDPAARGLGIGHRLVEECIRFARQTGYSKITLWTNDILTAARRLYEQTGFQLVKEEPHHSFGRDLIGQTWDLKL